MDDFRAKTHILLGLAVSFYIMKLIGWSYFSHIIMVAGIIIGSTICDCDNKYAPAGKVIPLHWFIKHRTWTHSVWAIVGAAALVYPFGIEFGVGFLAGVIFHILADTLTLSGVPLFYPIDKNTYGLRLFRVGNPGESMLALVAAMAIGYMVLG